MPLNINSQSYPYMLYVLISRSRISTRDYEMFLESELTYPGLAEVSAYCCSVFASKEISSVLLQNRSELSAYIAELNSLYAGNTDQSMVESLSHYQTQLDAQKSIIDPIELNAQNLTKTRASVVRNYIEKVKSYHDELQKVVKYLFNQEEDYNTLEYWSKEISTPKREIIDQLKKNSCIPEQSEIFNHPKEVLIVLLRKEFSTIAKASEIVNDTLRQFNELKEKFPEMNYDTQFDSLKNLEQSIEVNNSSLIQIAAALEEEVSKFMSTGSNQTQESDTTAVPPPALLSPIS